jgi:hypothetical protein
LQNTSAVVSGLSFTFSSVRYTASSLGAAKVVLDPKWSAIMTIWEILWWIISTLAAIISAVAVAVWWFRGQTKQAEIAGLKTANGALKEQFKSHEIAKAGEIAALKTSIETLREQIKTIEAAKAGEIAALREQIKAHEAWRGLAQDQTKQTAERLSIADATIMTLRGQLPSGAPKEALMAAATAVHSAIASNTIVAKSLDPEFQSTPPAERLSKLEQSKKDTTDVLKKTGELDLEALIPNDRQKCNSIEGRGA